MDILVLYQFCSFGGVERVLLNRAMAFKSCDMDVTLSVGYLQDFGALDSFRQYIRAHQLEQNLSPFLVPADFSAIHRHYDLILVIDTPQILEELAAKPNIFVECHTPYFENRQYLKHLPGNVQGILVPSQSFHTLLSFEFPVLRDHIFVLPNPVPDDHFIVQPLNDIFSKRPLTFLGRLDMLKNYHEAVQIFASVQERHDIFQIVIGQGETLQKKLDLLEKNHLLGNTLLRDRISFEKVPLLTNLVRQNRGIFISPSKGESFGLSAAEFMCAGVPALLSDIPPHRELVEGDERFLYPLGNILSAKKKLSTLLDNWESMSTAIVAYTDKFRYETFITHWLHFLHHFGYPVE